MNVVTFNQTKGVYYFQLEQLESTLHAHPAIEMIWMEEGTITLQTPTIQLEDSQWAIIEANRPHQITSAQGRIHLLVLECWDSLLEKWLQERGIIMDQGIATAPATVQPAALFQDLLQFGLQEKRNQASDARVQQCLNYLASATSNYHEMLAILKARTHLSESRLAHLFKAEVGISMKQYLVWSKLKRATQKVLNGEANFYEAAFQVGFYDQAHLSKAFKKYLGVNPSTHYNSRTLQI